jgi:MFS family permease
MTSKSSSTSVTTTAAEIPDPRRWKAFALLSLAQFVVILDTSIIGVALPTIQQHFGFSQTDLQWIFNAYVIVFGALLLLGGRLSDILGQRTIFIIGFITLTITSVVAGQILELSLLSLELFKAWEQHLSLLLLSQWS